MTFVYVDDALNLRRVDAYSDYSHNVSLSKKKSPNRIETFRGKIATRLRMQSDVALQ